MTVVMPNIYETRRTANSGAIEPEFVKHTLAWRAFAHSDDLMS